mmetsp:Transcript_48530/g.152495  ORF Transcript_48530/g.152495 Transcript_48530/m.152495 type:complete len:425 (+) Transcript_48530:233-1507(+)
MRVVRQRPLRCPDCREGDCREGEPCRHCSHQLRCRAGADAGGWRRRLSRHSLRRSWPLPASDARRLLARRTGCLGRRTGLPWHETALRPSGRLRAVPDAQRLHSRRRARQRLRPAQRPCLAVRRLSRRGVRRLVRRDREPGQRQRRAGGAGRDELPPRRARLCRAGGARFGRPSRSERQSRHPRPAAGDAVGREERRRLRRRRGQGDAPRPVLWRHLHPRPPRRAGEPRPLPRRHLAERLAKHLHLGQRQAAAGRAALAPPHAVRKAFARRGDPGLPAQGERGGAPGRSGAVVRLLLLRPQPRLGAGPARRRTRVVCSAVRRRRHHHARQLGGGARGLLGAAVAADARGRARLAARPRPRRTAQPRRRGRLHRGQADARLRRGGSAALLDLRGCRRRERDPARRASLRADCGHGRDLRLARARS